MKRNYLIICLASFMLIMLSLSCKKDSISQAPPQIVVAQKPSISSVSPNTGAPGTAITIAGTNFKTSSADDTVRFNGVAAVVSSATASQLVVNAPSGGTTGNITVTTADGTSSGINFTYTSATTGPDIYIAGSDGVYAVYWKNGTEVRLTDGSKTSRATSIFISGNDIYVAGYEGPVAKYWKNGTGVSLTNGARVCRATGIIADGANVYVSGFVGSPLGTDYTLAAYWSNGTLSILTDTNHFSMASGLTLYGNIPYITGIESGREGHNVNTAFYRSLTGITDYFTDDTTFSISTSICTGPGGGTYVGGYISYGAGLNAEPEPQVWLNGAALYGTYSIFPGFCYGIAVDSTGEIYLAGTAIQPGKKAIATLYKGLGPQAFGLTDGTNPAGAYGVAVHGSDLYVAGFDSQPSNNGVAVYWKNGVRVPLPVASSTAGAYAIVVK
jgi:uncharacterized protein (TIGR03437 family)